MDYIIAIIFFSCFLIPFLLEKFKKDMFLDFLEKHELAIRGVQILGTLGVIISIGLTVYQFNSSQNMHYNELKDGKITRLKSLQFELKLNEGILENEISKVLIDNNDHSISIPEGRFYIDILKAAINDGIFVDDDSFVFLNLFRLMKVCNSFLDQSMQIRNYEHLVDPRNSVLKSGQRYKIDLLMKEVGNYITIIREELPKANPSTQLMIEEIL